MTPSSILVRVDPQTSSILCAAVVARRAELDSLRARAAERAASFIEAQLRDAAAPRSGGPSAASAASETSHVHGLVRTLRPLIGVLARFSPQLLGNVKAVYHRRMAGTLRALCAALAHEAKSSAPRRAVGPAPGQPSLAAKSDSARALARYVAAVCVEQLCNFRTSSTADLAKKGPAFL